MVRNILAVIVGYAIFVITSVALFRVSGQKPHAEATVTFQILTALYGAIFSFLSGFTLQVIAKTNTLNLNFILAVILAGFAAFSMFKSEGSSWTQWLAILIFAPATIVGGAFYLRRSQK